ncbi:MAG: metallophosphoesterase family protein [Desulfatiglandales bacterium]
MSEFSFVHTADLHLDSPFSAVRQNNKVLAETLRKATFEAFDRVIRLCIDHHVDFLLVAGDVFDGEDRSLRAQIRFRDGLTRLSEAGIQAVVVCGNHDPLCSWASSLAWPPGARLVGEHLENLSIERDGTLLARIQGISYPKREEKRNLSRIFHRQDSAFHIGLLHSNLGSDTGHEPYAPCSLDDLKAAGMDYWALGHVHTRKVLSENPPVVVYPGNIQGRHIREAGEKGCYLVRVKANNEVALEFHPTDAVRWVTGELPIQGIRTLQDLMETLEKVSSEIAEKGKGRPTISRIALRGSGPLHHLLQRPETAFDILDALQEMGMARSPFLWVEKVETEIFPPVDLEVSAEERGFLGELLRYSRDLRHAPDFEERLSKELDPLFSNPRARRFIAQPDAPKLHQLLRAAERLCAQGLYGGEKGA